MTDHPQAHADHPGLSEYVAIIVADAADRLGV